MQKYNYRLLLLVEYSIKWSFVISFVSHKEENECH